MSDVKQLKIEEYSLVDFVMKIQQGIRDGYEVNDTSDDAPIQIGGAFHLIMREATKPNIVIGKAVFEASLDTTKLQEQLKAGGEIEQMLADSLVVDEKLSTEEFSALANEAADLIDKVDNLLVKAEAKHIEATTPVKATPKQTRGKK
jgi:hypothetical protein